MASYTLTAKAKEDINNIWEYTVDTWSERQADNYYEILIEAFKKLSFNPSIGKTYSDVTSGILGYHVGKHLIFYRTAGEKEIIIIRVLHERMDIGQHVSE